MLLATLKTVLPDISGYGTHSLKRGAVSTAMNSGLVTTDQIDLHAGWKCPGSKKLYTEPELNSKLAVTRSLNL